MKLGFRFFVLTVLAFAGPEPVRADYTATVNPNSVLVNNFQGWGTSLCWWANVVGNYPNRTNFVNMAFTQLQLNIARYNIGGGENPSSPVAGQGYRTIMYGFEPTNGIWNWNADMNQRWVLQQAEARGVNLVDAFANSPPWWMCVNSNCVGNASYTNNLQVDCEVPFAVYLATVVSNLTILDGDHFNYVTPMNEPNGSKWYSGSPSQEGCNMSPAQQSVVVGDLSSQLQTIAPAVQIDAAEDVDPYQTYNDLTSYSSGSLGDVSLLSTHTYSLTGESDMTSESSSQNKPLWVTEYGDSDGSGLTMALHIYQGIGVMRARAWCYWQVIDSASGWGFLLNSLLATTNASYTTNYTINEKFYTMGQFSEFVHPGCNIISVNDTNTLAAYNPTNGTLTLVMINSTSSSLNVTYNLSDFGSVPWQVSATQTDPTENMATISPPGVTNEAFIAAIPASSVTTFVLTTNQTAPTISSPFATPYTNTAQLFPGETADFSVSATGTTPLYYQWFSNGVAVAEATAASYTLPNSATLNNGTWFDCVVSNSLGSATSMVWSVSIVPEPTAAYPQAVLALDPTGYWPMHEVEAPAQGDIETNYGTLGNLAYGYYPDYQVNSGAFIRSMPGPLANGSDQSVLFTEPVNNGGAATNAILVPRTSPLTTLKPPFTVELWYMATNFPVVTWQGDIWSQMGDGGTRTQGIRLYYQNSVPSDLISVLTYGSAGGQVNIPAPAMTNNVWHHLVVTCSAATNFTAWMDGVSVASGSEVGKYTPDNRTPFTVANGLGFVRSWHGLEAEVAVYTNVISDIATHYNDGINASASAGQYFYDVTNDNPVVYLRLNNPGYTIPGGPWPTLLNYGQTNGVAVADGAYTPGTLPGVVTGAAYNNFPNDSIGPEVTLMSGVSSFGDAGYAPVYNPIGGAPFTVSAIFRGNPIDTNRVQSIVGHGTNSWELGLTSLGRLAFNSGTNSAAAVATGSGAGDLVSTVYVNDGNWHQVIAACNDGTNILYVDGVANNTNVVTINNLGNSLDVMIGSDPCYTNNPVGLGRQFAGQVCDVAFFTNALTGAEVQTLYNSSGIMSMNSTNLAVMTMGGNQLMLSWPTDHIGWQLQAQTNSVSAGIGTNWVNINGSTTTNQISVPIDLNNGSVFYRLIYP